MPHLFGISIYAINLFVNHRFLPFDLDYRQLFLKFLLKNEKKEATKTQIFFVRCLIASIQQMCSIISLDACVQKFASRICGDAKRPFLIFCSDYTDLK